MYSPSPSNKSYMVYANNKANTTTNPSSNSTTTTGGAAVTGHSASTTNNPLNSLLSAASLLLSDDSNSNSLNQTTSPTVSESSSNSTLVTATNTTTTTTTIPNPNNNNNNGKMMNNNQPSPSDMFDGYLELQDGTRYYGKLFGANKCLIENDSNWNSPFSVSGECVFTTAMVGYPESLTDPSYHGQILVLTFPLVGNYGAPNFKTTVSNNGNKNLDEFGLLPKLESDKIHIRGLIVQDYSHNYSHYEAICSLHRWLQEYNIPALYHIDTRAITKKLRDEKSMLARIVTNINYEHELSIKGLAPLQWYDPGQDVEIIKKVTCKDVTIYGKGNKFKVIAIDCGMKYNIIRELVKRDVELKVVPYNYNWLELDVNNSNNNNTNNDNNTNNNNTNNTNNTNIDGIFISNGPGNPNNFHETISILSEYISLVQQQQQVPIIPIFGICLGNQLVGKAIGASVYKLPFGNRGHNQPVIDQLTRKCFITSQNHGYAIDNQTLPSNFKPYFINANDQSNEGVYCLNLPIFTAQFHPEAKGGPSDTFFLFDQFIDLIKLKISNKLHRVKNFESKYSKVFIKHHKNMKTKFNQLLKSVEDTSDISTPILKQQESLMKKSIFNQSIIQEEKKLSTLDEKKKVLPKKVIILGSGGLQIGQAGEFDYSGSQAIKALKEEGIYTILVNPNIATVQTCKELADRVYFGAVTPDFVEKVIKKENADGLLLSFGGQTALNCGVQLHKSGVLEELNCRVLGTPVQSIIDTEDRDIFNQKMREISQPIADSKACDNVEEAILAASHIGYPVIIRAAFALGGLGSGFANDERELRELATQALSSSPQILVEKSVKGWKEVEYEVVRDCNDNCITVCNMENFDPVGIHTGESIVVAPSQTLNNDEYHMLRTAAIKVIRHLGIVGECNIQYALNPYSKEYVIIEVNARLSRSSALASKATGYPLAFVAAKLSLGMELIDIKNSVTKETIACFEPALDYCVVKMPRWDLKKFTRVSTVIGSAMKSVGEVMAIGRNFEEAIQKAIRMVDTSYRGFDSANSSFDLEKLMKQYSSSSNTAANTNTTTASSNHHQHHHQQYQYHHHSGSSHNSVGSANTNYGSFGSGSTHFGSFGQTHYGSFGSSSHSHLFNSSVTNPFALQPQVSPKEDIKQKIIRELTHPTDQRIFAISLAMEHFEMTVDQIHQFTQIDRWFLYKLQNIIQTKKALVGIGKLLNSLPELPYPLLLLSKQQGFSDLQIASSLPSLLYHEFLQAILKNQVQFPYQLSCFNNNTNTNNNSNNTTTDNTNNTTNNNTNNTQPQYKDTYKNPPKLSKIDKELMVRFIRKYQYKIEPIVKQIDTLAAEYPAQTNYLYTTYNAGINSIGKEGGEMIYPDHCYHHDVSFNDEGIIVLGSGVYRIGSSVEFDYCGVMSVRELKRLNYKTIMINYNPETVSTDYDEPDRLYFEELSLERVLDIYELEHSQGVIVSVGGQQPNNIVLPLDKQCHVKILGTSSDSIDKCEDRSKFSQLLDSLVNEKTGDKLVYQPEWANLITIEDALIFANKVQYPVLIRPSYVLSGAAMNVAYSDSELLQQLYMAADVSKEHPVVISKFYENAKEIEIDGVAMNGEIIIDAISEHVERAGTHSGDATLICPPYSLSFDIQDLIREKASMIVKSLSISGPFNMQFLFDNECIHDDDQEEEEEHGQQQGMTQSFSTNSLDGYDDSFESESLYLKLSKRLRVIECNLRASRSFPFISKTLDLDFIALATRIFTHHFNLPSSSSSLASSLVNSNTITSLPGSNVPTRNYYQQMNLLEQITMKREQVESITHSNTSSLQNNSNGKTDDNDR
ncbi:predicted protein [Naegleria gruberi]|uniref:Predicted protein n=1 Tax=Naegleria gruberi TaxID=5762 RepID=D2VZ04_NAEGR|nr:uncharacterized protein NAEGRDRAFT_59636 [Naegleria gruberi]EFC37906.1 predicted protein [Naegleria gruberi]|eukprot:XP_002670650.1 predicted protein [Naegleria gruberi strain NEG-M]